MGWCSANASPCTIRYQARDKVANRAGAGCRRRPKGLNAEIKSCFARGYRTKVRIMEMRKKPLQVSIALLALAGASRLAAQPAAEPQSLGASGLALPRLASPKPNPSICGKAPVPKYP